MRIMKREVMELWRVCFDDTEEFIQFYFDKKYKDENALVYWDEQGAAIAALQTPLYPMTFGVTQIVTGYISGACTHPLARPGCDDEVTAGGFLCDERKKDSHEYPDSGQ